MASRDINIYLDYNATTPLVPEVLDAIHTTLRDAWGNPSSSHHAGTAAKSVIIEARKWVAEMINATPNDIIFTSGGTEANNMVIHTALQHYEKSGSRGDEIPHIITSNLEHDSVKLVLEELEKKGKAQVSYVAASRKSGRVEVDDVVSAVRPNTCLVTVMMANNETGIIQPIHDIMAAVKFRTRGSKLPHILRHTDAAQAIGKIPVDVADLEVDYLTIVGHKFYGPRNGALYVRDPGVTTPLYPMLYGGGQERNFRPGTENTGMVAGLGKAAELVVKHLETYDNHMREVRDYLERRLLEVFGDLLHFNGKFACSERLPNTCNVSIRGERLIGSHVLSYCQHTQASIGAACHSGSSPTGSHILLAIGVPEEIARNALRLSVGRETTKDDIDVVIGDLKQAVAKCQS